MRKVIKFLTIFVLSIFSLALLYIFLTYLFGSDEAAKTLFWAFIPILTLAARTYQNQKNKQNEEL